MRHVFLSVLSIMLALVGQGASAQMADLPLVPGDSLQISVFGRDDLSGVRQVDSSGRIVVPLAGRVVAAGLFAEQLEERLRAILQKTGFVDQPFLTVEVLKREDIFVDGDVTAPGAFEWRPGLTLAQAVALAGGRKEIRIDEIGTALQAYRSQEDYEALQIQISGLEAREARLQAELAVSSAAFGLAPTAGSDDLGSLNLESLAQLLGSGSANTALADLANLDLDRRQAVWAKAADLPLIRFPDAIAEDPKLESLRRTHEALLRDHVAINLASFSSLQLQAAASKDRLKALRSRQEIVGGMVDALDTQMKQMLDLKAGGLVRSQDVLNAQTSLSEATSTQLEVLDSIAATEVDGHKQELAIGTFASSLRSDLQADLEATRSQLLEADARLPSARRSADISETYRQRDPDAGDAASVSYALVRRDVYGTPGSRVDQGTLLMPGDIVTVNLAPRP